MATTDAPPTRRPPARVVALTLVGVLLYGLFLLAQAPAGLLAWGLQRISGGALLLEGVDGTLWRGSAARLAWMDAGQVVELGRASWSWRPLELTRARLGHHVAIDASALHLRGSIAVGAGGIELERLDASLRAEVAGRLLPTLGLLHPRGDFELEARALRLGRHGQTGTATLVWRDARSGLIDEPLGDYRLLLSPAPGGASALRLETLRGPLRAQGEGSWRAPDKLALRATLQPPAERLQHYAPALNLLSRPAAGGVYVLELRSP